MNIKREGHSLTLVQVHSDSTFSNLFSLETTGPPCAYVVKTLKNSLFGTKRPITLKLGMQYRLIDYYQIYSNDDTGLTLAYFTTKSSLFPYAFVWEKIKIIFLSMISKLVDAVNQMSRWSIMNIKCQGHSLTFVQGHSCSAFSNVFSLETPKQIEAKFHVEPPWGRRMKVSTTGLCRITTTAAISIYGKNLYKSSCLKPNDRWHWNFICGIDYWFLYGKTIKLTVRFPRNY